MISNRPYLIRALNEWLLDNQWSPHILVDARQEGVEVPSEFITDGKIVLNISPFSIRGLEITNDTISFHARFSGTPYNINVPIDSVLAIYAKENGQGMIFPEEAAADNPGKGTEKTEHKPHLKVVK